MPSESPGWVQTYPSLPFLHLHAFHPQLLFLMIIRINEHDWYSNEVFFCYWSPGMRSIRRPGGSHSFLFSANVTVFPGTVLPWWELGPLTGRAYYFGNKKQKLCRSESEVGHFHFHIDSGTCNF